jgi:hypothetical protein
MPDLAARWPRTQLALPPVDDRFRNRSELVNHDQPADDPGREADFSGHYGPGRQCR